MNEIKMREFIRITAGARHAWIIADIGGAYVPIRKQVTAEVMGLVQMAEEEAMRRGTIGKIQGIEVDEDCESGGSKKIFGVAKRENIWQRFVKWVQRIFGA